MAEGQERTEQATPKRRSDARKKGQFARSAELPGAVALLAGVIALRAFGPGAWGSLSGMLQQNLSNVARADMQPNDVLNLIGQTFLAAALAIAPLVLALAAAGISAGLVQTRFVVAPQHLAPKFDRVNPLSGFKRIFSLNAGFELVKILIKLTVMAAVAYNAVSNLAGEVLHLGQVGMTGAPGVIGDILLTVMTRIAFAGAILAGIDYGYQKWQFEKNLKMTKQEIKDEMKHADGDPQVKGRIRRLQRALAQKRMMQDVPKATVVVTNPTHYAVALRYESGKTRAPVVLAKGQDHIAQHIKAVARQHGVPVVENPPLARALHASVPIGKEIPAQLYRAVAELLAFVYRLKRRW